MGRIDLLDKWRDEDEPDFWTRLPAVGFAVITGGRAKSVSHNIPTKGGSMKAPETMDEAVQVALSLMKGDPEIFKAGYSAENAVIAVAEAFNFEQADLAEALADADGAQQAIPHDEICEDGVRLTWVPKLGVYAEAVRVAHTWLDQSDPQPNGDLYGHWWAVDEAEDFLGAPWLTIIGGPLAPRRWPNLTGLRARLARVA